MYLCYYIRIIPIWKRARASPWNAAQRFIIRRRLYNNNIRGEIISRRNAEMNKYARVCRVPFFLLCTPLPYVDDGTTYSRRSCPSKTPSPPLRFVFIRMWKTAKIGRVIRTLERAEIIAP